MFDRFSRWLAGSHPDDPIELFLFNVRRSGLIEEARIEQLRQEYEKSKKPFGNSLTSLMTFLISRNALTHWQVAKLRENKHKGFIMDDYVLLDHISSTEESSRYLARKQVNETLVALVVYPPRSEKYRAGIKYDVEVL